MSNKDIKTQRNKNNTKQKRKQKKLSDEERIEKMKENLIQLRKKKGDFYKNWVAGMVKWLYREIHGEQKKKKKKN